ncbi:MAG TPA: phospholipid carrier-dependent glycosyltransferase [Lacunisphaera sp.]|nr:phospholipid carrier-dependent glycosyltransferase [Lacunisphaera sp.]
MALLLALGHAALATFAMRDKSTTVDELAHVTGGYTFNHWNDYRLHPENGILPQRWQALPASLQGAHFPALTERGWQKSVVWLVGYDFFYESGNDPDQLLFGARAMNSLLGAATALLVFFWSFRLWGAAGAAVSLGLCLFCPTMLAHSGLATSDMGMAFFLVAAPSAYWWHLHDGRRRAWLVSALTLGLAAVAKYTAVLLLPIFGLLALIRILQPASLACAGRTHVTRGGRAAVIFASTVLQGLVAAAVIWAFFGFRFSLFNPELGGGEPNLTWDILLSFGGGKAAVIGFLRDWRLLPEGWLYGLAFVLLHAQARGAFLDGDYGIFGWVEFFPKTFLYKTPPSLMVALVASALLLFLHLRTLDRPKLNHRLHLVAPLIVLFGVYWLFSLTSHLNIGHRHILPTYPVLYIFCGLLGWAATRALRESRVTGLVVVLFVASLVGGHVLIAARIHPHYLAYFGPVAGGPEDGYHHLVDSSLDWGQDLPGLKQWLATHRRAGEPVYISYFGSDEPHRFVPDAILMPRLSGFDRARPWYWCEPGVYAISATMLQHVYTPDKAHWTAEHERRYQQLRLNDGRFRALKSHPEATPELLQGISKDDWAHAWNVYEPLRFARLCQYLRARRPDATAGYSILIYRLTREELAAALESDATTLARAIGQASSSGN